MNTKAAVLHKMKLGRPYSDSNPLKIEQLTLDDPGFNEVVVKIKAAGLCHSDLSVIDGNRPRPLPMALGHEAAGVVIALGKGVKKLSLGDHVVFAFLPSCGTCSYCHTGRAALCEPGAEANGKGTLLGGHQRIHNKGDYYYHHLGVSGFAELAVASVDSLVKIDQEIPFEIAALFGCAVMTGVGAVVNTAQLKFGESILIVGLGGVGLSAILGAKAAGASNIIVADLNPQKRAKGLELGADDYIGKPFEPKELILRIKNILTKTIKTDQKRIIEFENVKIDLNKLLIIKNKKEFKINNTEKIILEKMINNPGNTFSRESIGQLINLDKERSIDVIITRLRKKIEIDPKNPKFLQTIRGAGYVLWIE